MTIKSFSDVEEGRKFYLDEVDRIAEKSRGTLAAPGSGQAMTYDVKYQEALAGGGTMLEMEADKLGVPLQEVIDSVLERRKAWLVAGGQIEAARVKAKKDIRAETKASEMRQVVEVLKGQSVLVITH